MAAPAYTEDLNDIDLAEATGSYVAVGGGGAGLSADPDFAIEGTNSVTKQVSNARKGILFNNGAGITIPAGDHIFIWIYNTTPGLLDTIAVGGLNVSIGDATSARNEFHIVGATEYSQGGWLCVPIKYVTTSNGSHPYRTLVGSPSGDPQYFGVVADTTATVKAVNTSVDAIRYGTGAYITAGEVADEATFTGFAAANDATTARWGILTAIDGGFSLQGRFVVGQNNAQSATAAYFDDSNALVVLADTFHSETDFTQIIVDHASTTFNMTNITVLALGTNNPGRLVFNNASTTAALTTCTFDSIGITTLRAGVTATDCTWRNTGVITQNGATITGATISGNTSGDGVGAILADDLDEISTNSFTFSDGHAIEYNGTATATYTFTGNTFSGYGSDATTDAAVYNSNTSGTLTINVTGGVPSPTVRTASGGTTVVNNNVNITVTIQDSSGVVIPGAEVAIFQDNVARTIILASTETDEDGVVSSSAAASLGNIIIRVRQSTDLSTFHTNDDIAADVITVNETAHDFSDGDAFVYDKDGGTQAIGLTDGTTYYAGNTTTTTLEVYTTAALAIAGAGGETLTAGGTETHHLDPVRYVANSATGTIGASDFSAQITMVTDNIAIG